MLATHSAAPPAPELRCPRCGVPLSERADANRDVACHACNFALLYGDGQWDARVRRDHPLDFSRQWQLWEAGALGRRDRIYGSTPARDFEATLGLLGLEADGLASLRTLEVGFGHGRILAEFQTHCPRAYGVDLVKPLPSAGLRPGSTFCGSVFELPFAPGQFDVVICRGVIHHTPDPRGALLALAEQLGPGGRMHLYVYSPQAPRSLFLRRAAPWSWRLPESMRVGLSAALGAARTAQIAAAKHTVDPEKIRTWYGSYTLGFFDILSPRWTSVHTADEVLSWFADAGLEADERRPQNYIGTRAAA